MDVKEAGQPGAGPSEGGIARRRLIGAGIGGAAISLLPFLGGRAGATTPPTDPSATTTAPPATTTTAPTRRPTSDDIALLVFAEALEVTARDLYDLTLGAVELDDVQRTVLATIREAHEAYFHSLSAMLGRQGTGARVEELFTGNRAAFEGDATTALEAGYQLESIAVATHTELVGQLQGIDGARLIASILVVEARHCTVLADLAGKTELDDLLVNKADALTPAEG